jgi:uncharacterized protein
MPEHDSYPLGAPCWVDLTTSDPERSRAFYGELFGWTADEPVEQFGGYFNFRKDGVLVAGGMAAQPGTPDVWSVYLTTDDAEKTVEMAAANGGQVVIPPMAVADLGTMAILVDPGGAAIGMWQPGSHQGFGAIGDPGTPSWFELHTRDYDDAVAFYREVFRCETQVVGDEAGFRYTTLVHGTEMLAGIMDAGAFLPEGAPAAWSVYFGVDDADAALAKTVELGGTIDTPAEDTPYGRLAVAADPTGARFKLVAPNEDMPGE